ncbi:MAG: hypothetical protein Fur0018_24480 [Anaerolineales bacterium]
MSIPKATSTHLFILRIWEQTDATGAPSHWRGLVQHVESGQKLYFTSMRDLNDFIILKMHQTGPPNMSASKAGKGGNLPD